MTAENETTQEQETPYGGVPFVCFGVPGVPFSKVQVPLSEEWIAEGVRMARVLYERFNEEFNATAAGYVPFPEPERAPVGQEFAPSVPPPQFAPAGPKPPRDGVPQGGEVCNQCGAAPVWWVPGFTNKKTGKDVSPRIVCTNCKDGQYDHLVRWVQTANAGAR